MVKAYLMTQSFFEFWYIIVYSEGITILKEHQSIKSIYVQLIQWLAIVTLLQHKGCHLSHKDCADDKFTTQNKI